MKSRDYNQECKERLFVAVVPRPRVIPRQQTPEYNVRRHSLALLRSLIELYPKESIEIVRQVALDGVK